MSELQFPSGPWIGFYTYGRGSQRHLMDLVLSFHHGVIAGEGADDIGFFGIHGRYSPEGGECSWTKAYIGRHSVEYSGFREQKGIWGTWTIGAIKGGFHIWPLGEAGLSLEEQADVEAETPAISSRNLVRQELCSLRQTLLMLALLGVN